MQLIERVYTEAPFKGRANTLVYILVSNAQNVHEIVSTYMVEHPQSRTPIPVNWLEIESRDNDPWYVRNTIAKFLFSHDLFDYQLPLYEDLYFFVRPPIVGELIDSIRKSENRNIFGLRKTGKTSILYKVERTCNDNNIAKVIYFDCKKSDIRSKRWVGLLGLITEKIIAALSLPPNVGINDGIIDRFVKVVKHISSTTRVCAIFDEVEYIFPQATLDPHWKRDFIELWQMLWSVQNENRRINFIIAGVNFYPR